MPKKLVIIGIGEFAQIACEYFSFDSDYEVAAFAVDTIYLPATQERDGLPVIDLRTLSHQYPSKEFEAFVAIPATNLNRNRELVCNRISALGYKLATYVSSHAFVWRNVTIGENCFVFENNVLQPWVRIGSRCVLWSGNHVGHRSEIESDVFVASHVVVSGYCRIGHHSFLGVNATINDGIEVAHDCVIGASAHVTRNTDSGLVYVGQPARALPNRRSTDVDL